MSLTGVMTSIVSILKEIISYEPTVYREKISMNEPSTLQNHSTTYSLRSGTVQRPRGLLGITGFCIYISPEELTTNSKIPSLFLVIFTASPSTNWYM